MKYKLKKYVLGLLAITLIITSCDKNEEQIASLNTQKNELGYKVKNGYLAFDNKESFIKTVEFVSKMNDKQRRNWEASIGFESQQSIINNLINEELIKDSLNRIKYANTDLSKIDKRNYHSDYYYKVLSKGIIKLIDEGTTNEYWDNSVYNRSSIQYVNEDGLYSIADTLYQVTNCGLKSILLISASNKENTLKKLGMSNKIVKRITDKANVVPNKGEIWPTDWTEKGSWPSVRRRIKVGIELTFVEFLIPLQRIEFKHNYFVKCQKTNLFNVWIYEWTNVEVTGNWRISAYFYDQIYESNATYNTYCSDLKCCVDPATGSFPPYGNNFWIYPNEQNSYVYWEINYNDYLPIFAYYHWTARRPDVNISSSLSYN